MNHQRRTGFCDGSFRDHGANGLGGFDGTPKPKPEGRGKTAEKVCWRITQVENNDAQPARMQKQVSRSHRMFQIAAALNPAQALQLDTVQHRGRRIERIHSIDDRADLAPAGTFGEKTMQ
ncbi:MAG: hypothetical protein ABI824_07295 [Acidobacteriota bacterium]